MPHILLEAYFGEMIFSNLWHLMDKCSLYVKRFQEISKDIMKILCFDNCCKYTLRINYQKIILQISPQWKHGSSWNSVCQYITTLKSISVNFQKDLYFHYWDIWKMISLINFNFQCIVPTFIKKKTNFSGYLWKCFKGSLH